MFIASSMFARTLDSRTLLASDSPMTSRADGTIHDTPAVRGSMTPTLASWTRERQAIPVTPKPSDTQLPRRRSLTNASLRHSTSWSNAERASVKDWLHVSQR